MARRLDKTLADYMVVAISPALIMTLIASLVFFLLTVFYQGQFEMRLCFICSMFIMGTVLIARIAMRESSEYAMLFSIPLAIVSMMAMTQFVRVSGPMASASWLINCGILGLIWWSSHKLTWDCTLIDESQDSSGEGLLQNLGLDADTVDPLHGSPNNSQDATQPITGAAIAERPPLWQRLFRPAKNRPPGLWVIYFSLAAIPLFGIGQWFIDASDVASRRYAFRLLMVYVFSGLGLLLTTSFLGLRRYLRQRQLTMPSEVAGVWLSFGTGFIVLLLLAASLLPRPGVGIASARLPFRLQSPVELSSSDNAFGNDGVDDSQADDSEPGNAASDDGANDRSKEAKRRRQNDQFGTESDHAIKEDRVDSKKPNESPDGSPNNGNQKTSNSSQSAGKTESGKSQSGKSQSGKSQSGKSQSGKGESGKSESGKSESGKSESGKSQSGKSPSGKSQSGKSESGKSESGKSQSGKSQSGKSPSGKSQSGKSQSGKSQSGKSESGKSESGKSQSGKSQSGKSQSGKSQSGKSQSGKSQSGKSQSGKSQSGKSESGKSESGKSESGKSESGKSQSGKGESGSTVESKKRESGGRGVSGKAKRPPQQRQMRSPVRLQGGWLNGLLFAFKFLLYAALIGFVIWYAWKNRVQLRAAIQRMWSRWLAWWRGEVVDESGSAAPQPAIPPPAFSTFDNPFETGMATRVSAEELVHYSFDAFEAWARERNLFRSSEQTVHEFTRLVARQETSVADVSARLASIYAQAAYARGTLTSKVQAPLRELWSVLGRSSAT